MATTPLPDLAALRQNAQRFARGFTTGQKAVTVVALLAAVIGGVLVMSATGKPTYVTLFSNLQAADAGSITAKLTSDKVPYKLAGGGTTVMVPASAVDKERLALAQSGLPAGGTVGLSLLDKEGITASNMTQQADYLQAIQGELEKTIDSIAGVQSSQVNVALPANQDFALNNNNPTGASVLVTMQPGRSLSTDEVQAIVHLVGSSVPNLSTGDVTVADASGELLAGPGTGAGGGAANGQTASYDGTVQAKVEQYLAAVLGPGNADVQVNATLNYDQVQTSTQSILPAAKGGSASFCTQTSQSNSTYNGAGAAAAGAAGATTPAPATGNGTGTYNQSQNTQTCETNEQTQTVQQAPGTVTSQSVAVLVNSSALPKGVSTAGLQSGVAAAAGINPARGDTLAFSAMPFNSAAAQQAAKAAAASAAATKKQATSSLIRTAVVMALIGLVLLAVWRSSRRARRQSPASLLSPADLAVLQALRPAEDTTVALPAPAVSALPPAAEEDLAGFVDGQPDEVAQLLRGWLDDSRAEVPAP